jgi:hypothetical protein
MRNSLSLNSIHQDINLALDPVNNILYALAAFIRLCRGAFFFTLPDGKTTNGNDKRRDRSKDCGVVIRLH